MLPPPPFSVVVLEKTVAVHISVRRALFRRLGGCRNFAFSLIFDHLQKNHSLPAIKWSRDWPSQTSKRLNKGKIVRRHIITAIATVVKVACSVRPLYPRTVDGMECHFARTLVLPQLTYQIELWERKNIWFGGIKFTTGRRSTANVKHLPRYIFNKLTTVTLIISAINFWKKLHPHLTEFIVNTA